jgi:hypothetical protein
MQDAKQIISHRLSLEYGGFISDPCSPEALPSQVDLAQTSHPNWDIWVYTLFNDGTVEHTQTIRA